MLVRPIERQPGESPHALGRRVCETLRTAKAVYIRGVDPERVDLRSFYQSMQDAIGRPLCIGEDALSGEPTGERWIGIRYDQSMPNRYRHACVAQPLHTDYAYTENNPELVLMYCVRRAAKGGESIFADADEIVRLLEACDPQLLVELRGRDVYFFKGGRGKVDRVISRDERGALLTWLYTCVHPGQAAEVRAMAARFSDFVATYVAPSKQLVVLPLEAGEAIVWHDRRLLHGRNAFEAYENDDRFLWKTAIFLAPEGLVQAK